MYGAVEKSVSVSLTTGASEELPSNPGLNFPYENISKKRQPKVACIPAINGRRISNSYHKSFNQLQNCIYHHIFREIRNNTETFIS
jgi:hypothetical protein